MCRTDGATTLERRRAGAGRWVGHGRQGVPQASLVGGREVRCRHHVIGGGGVERV